jgi:hypothetical protein
VDITQCLQDARGAFNDAVAQAHDDIHAAVEECRALPAPPCPAGSEQVRVTIRLFESECQRDLGATKAGFAANGVGVLAFGYFFENLVRIVLCICDICIVKTKQTGCKVHALYCAAAACVVLAAFGWLLCLYVDTELLCRRRASPTSAAQRASTTTSVRSWSPGLGSV